MSCGAKLMLMAIVISHYWIFKMFFLALTLLRKPGYRRPLLRRDGLDDRTVIPHSPASFAAGQKFRRNRWPDPRKVGFICLLGQHPGPVRGDGLPGHRHRIAGPPI